MHNDKLLEATQKVHFNQGEFWQIFSVEDIPRNESKPKVTVTSGADLGYVVDGLTGRFGISNKRSLEIVSLGLHILRRNVSLLLLLQIFAGNTAHAL